MSISSERRQYLQQYVTNVEFQRMGKDKTTTVCMLEVYNGFKVVGSSHCVDPNKFSRELGEEYSKEDAYEKLDGYFGMLEKDKLYTLNKASDPVNHTPKNLKVCYKCGKPTEGTKVVVEHDENDNPIRVRHLKKDCRK